MRIAHSHGRQGVSEITGTVLMIAMTVVAGFAVWGFVDQQAGLSASAYANKVGSTVGYLEENFIPVTISWSGTTSIISWVYNVGATTLEVSTVRIYDSGGTVNLYFSYSGSTNQVQDYLTGSTSGCIITATSYESPTVSSFQVLETQTGSLTLTIPPLSAQPAGQTCKSFGATLTSGDTYTVVITGLYGNVQSVSLKK